MRLSPKFRAQVHYHWLSGISFVMGYLWFISGLNKILSENFPEKFVAYSIAGFLTDDVFGWYRSLYTFIIQPHSLFFGYLVEWSELTFGILFILGTIWLLLSDSRIPHLLIAVASAGSAIFIFNILAAHGEIIPIADIGKAFEEGVNTDALVFMISLILFFGNSWELARSWLPLKRKHCEE